MDDLKHFGKSCEQIDSLAQTVRIFSTDNNNSDPGGLPYGSDGDARRKF